MIDRTEDEGKSFAIDIKRVIADFTEQLSRCGVQYRRTGRKGGDTTMCTTYTRTRTELALLSVMSARCAHHFGTRLLQLVGCKVFFPFVGCIPISSGPWRPPTAVSSFVCVRPGNFSEEKYCFDLSNGESWSCNYVKQVGMRKY